MSAICLTVVKSLDSIVLHNILVLLLLQGDIKHMIHHVRDLPVNPGSCFIYRTVSLGALQDTTRQNVIVSVTVITRDTVLNQRKTRKPNSRV